MCDRDELSVCASVCVCVLSCSGDVALFAYSARAQVLPSFTQRCLPRRALAAPAPWGPPLTPQHFSTDKKWERCTQKGEPSLRFKKPSQMRKVRCVCACVCVWVRASPWWQPWLSSYSGGIRLLKERELKQNTRVCRNLIVMQAEKRSKSREGQRQKEEPRIPGSQRSQKDRPAPEVFPGGYFIERLSVLGFINGLKHVISVFWMLV